jgi:hypothetical protein
VNLLAARVVLRPRALADVLDLTIPFCLACKRVLGRLAVVALLPALALCLYLRLGAHWRWPQVWALAIGLGDLLEGLFTVALGDLLFGATVRPAAVWGRFLRRLPVYVVTWVLARLIVGATLFFFPLAPFAAVHLMFVREAVLLEGASVGGSLGRSYRFVQRHIGSCIGLLLALLLAPAVMAVGAELLGDAIVDGVLQLGKPFGALFKEGGSGYALAGYFLAVPVVAAARFLKYIDVRTRKEGWDIQLRFTAVAAADRDRHELGRGSAA